MLKQPQHQVPRLRARPPADRRWPDAVLTPGAALVQRRPARRQPGADRADGQRAQAAHVRDAGADRLQGDRGRLSLGVADRVRFRAPAHRAKTCIPDDVTIQVLTQARARPDRAHLRIAARRAARDRSPVQRHRAGDAPRRARPRRGRHRRARDDACAADRRPARRSQPETRLASSVLARDVFGHRARVLQARGRCGDRGLAADAAAQVHHQPAVDRGAFDAEHLRRHDRVDAPEPRAARRDRAVGASAQRPRHRHGRRRVRADGGRRPHRRLPVRQRRAHRQRRPRQHRAEPVHAGRVDPGLDFSRHRRGAALRRALQPAAGASAPSVCRATWSTPRSPVRTRTRSRRPLRRAARATSGTCPTCRSTRRTSGAATTR